MSLTHALIHPDWIVAKAGIHSGPGLGTTWYNADRLQPSLDRGARTYVHEILDMS
jgi:hypothetical protein